jgi:hypothetical protein
MRRFIIIPSPRIRSDFKTDKCLDLGSVRAAILVLVPSVLSGVNFPQWKRERHSITSTSLALLASVLVGEPVAPAFYSIALIRNW